jgi:hypothetical protein
MHAMRMIPTALLLGLCLGTVSCTSAPSGSRPSTVAAAADSMLALIDEQSRRDLAYMADDELISLHHGFGMTVREQFGLWKDNPRLLKDCKSSHPDDCSMEIIEAMHARLRAALPADERARLVKLESNMDRVRLTARDFKDTPLPEFVAFLQAAVDAQLPAGDRFRIQFEPRDAGYLVSAEVGDGSLYELYRNMLTGLDFTKALPDLQVAPYYRPLEGIGADGLLERVYFSNFGMHEEARELVRDQAGWQAMQGRLLTAARSMQFPPSIDFTKYSALVIALGERPTHGYEVNAEALGLHRSVASVAIRESRPGKSCMVAQTITYPVAVFLLPRVATGVTYLEGISDRECGAG